MYREPEPVPLWRPFERMAALWAVAAAVTAWAALRELLHAGRLRDQAAQWSPADSTFPSD